MLACCEISDHSAVPSGHVASVPVNFARLSYPDNRVGDIATGLVKLKAKSLCRPESFWERRENSPSLSERDLREDHGNDKTLFPRVYRTRWHDRAVYGRACALRAGYGMLAFACGKGSAVLHSIRGVVDEKRFAIRVNRDIGDCRTMNYFIAGYGITYA